MILQGDFEKKQGIRYEFDRFQHPIGEGGMGVVYKGVMIDDDTNAVLRDVAIKEIKAEGTTDELSAIIQKARREASIRLHNDNLVEMLGFIEIEEKKLKLVKKKYYVISEFLTGVPLTDILDGKYLDYRGKTVDYARQIGEDLRTDRDHTAYYIIKNILYGITALHDNGYIHRDIDPSNIMITDDGRIKLIDFGIAKQLNDLNAQDEMTCDGTFIGKVEYASPELINGDIHSQDFTTDIYGVGVLFYKLLTGRLPFDGNRFEIMTAHLSKNVKTAAISNKKFRKIIQIAMAKKRDSRFHTSSEMRVALDQPDPMPSFKWQGLFSAVLFSVLLAVLLWPKSKDDPARPGKKDVIDDTTVIAPPIDPDDLPEVDWTSCNEEELWQILSENPDSAEVLFEIAKRFNNRKINQNAIDFWENHLVPDGYADRNIIVPSKRVITSDRFVFLVSARAMDNASVDTLREEIQLFLDELKNRFPDYYKYVPSSKTDKL